MDTQKQMTLNFEPGLSDKYKTVRRLIQERVGKSPKPQEYIAAEMGLSPSDLTRKLAQNPNDKRTFGVDDLCRYMDSQKDYTPVVWFIDKFGAHLRALQEDEIRKQIADLQSMLR